MPRRPRPRLAKKSSGSLRHVKRTPREWFEITDFFRKRSTRESFLESPFYRARLQLGGELYRAMMSQGMSYSQIWEYEAYFVANTSPSNVSALLAYRKVETNLKAMKLQ